MIPFPRDFDFLPAILDRMKLRFSLPTSAPFSVIGVCLAFVGLGCSGPDDVASLVHAHPTQTEALGEAFLALAGKPLHVHG